MVFDDTEKVSPDLGQESVDNPGHIPEISGTIGNAEYPQSTLPDVAFIAPGSINSEFERINAEISSISNWIKQFYDKFSNICESIQELRSNVIENEDSISKVTETISSFDEKLESNKKLVENLSRQFNPEKIRMDFGEINERINSFDEKLESNKKLIDNLVGEINKVKKKVEAPVNNKEILKLNERIKKDLIEIQKLGEKVKLNSDKSEKIFIDMNKLMSNMQRINAESGEIREISAQVKQDLENLNLKINDLDAIRSEVENLRAKNNELDTVRERMEKLVLKANELDAIRTEVEDLKMRNNELDALKRDNKVLRELVEKALFISNENKNSMKNFAVNLSEERNKKFVDYENRLDSILKVLDSLAEGISELKKKSGKPDVSVKLSDLNKKIKNLELSILKIQERTKESSPYAEISALKEQINGLNFPSVVSDLNRRIQNLGFSISGIKRRLDYSDFSSRISNLDNKLTKSNSSLFELRKKVEDIGGSVYRLGDRIERLEKRKEPGFFKKPVELEKSFKKPLIAKKKPVKIFKELKKEEIKKEGPKPASKKLSFVKRVFGIGEKEVARLPELPEEPSLPSSLKKQKKIVKPGTVSGKLEIKNASEMPKTKKKVARKKKQSISKPASQNFSSDLGLPELPELPPLIEKRAKK